MPLASVRNAIPLTAASATDCKDLQDILMAAALFRPYYRRAIVALTPLLCEGLESAVVDRHWRLYVDLDWLRALPLPVAASFIAAHVVEHLLRCHERLEGLADDEVVNIATDMEINDDLSDGQLLDGSWLPSQINAPNELMAEDYITYLLVDPSCIDHPGCGGGSGAGVPLDGELGERDDTSSGMSENEAAVMRRSVANDVMDHVRQHGYGSVPDGVQIWAKAQQPPVVYDWQTVLSNAVRSAASVQGHMADYTWSKLHRRTTYGKPLRPGVVKKRPRVGLGVDTSGSMGVDTLSVVLSIARAAGDIWVAQGDMGVLGAVSQRLPAQWFGGGGTDVSPLLEALAPISDIVLLVTDGDTPWPSEPPETPVVVVLIDGPRSVPAWATSVCVNPNKGQE